MGKASKWFRALLGLKKSDPNPNTRLISQPSKKKWSFAKFHKEKGHLKSQHVVVTNDNDPRHHAVAVVAATAAVAEAAVEAAEAAAVVVKLTSSSGRSTSTVPGCSGMSTAAYVSKTGVWTREPEGSGSRYDSVTFSCISGEEKKERCQIGSKARSKPCGPACID